MYVSYSELFVTLPKKLHSAVRSVSLLGSKVLQHRNRLNDGSDGKEGD